MQENESSHEDDDLKYTICLERLIDGVHLNVSFPCGCELHLSCIQQWKGKSKVRDPPNSQNCTLVTIT